MNDIWKKRFKNYIADFHAIDKLNADGIIGERNSVIKKQIACRNYCDSRKRGMRMNKVFEKILERLEEMIHPKQLYFCKYARGGCRHLYNNDKDCMDCVVELAKEIVQEVEEEYKEDMKYSLAEMYAKNMVDYGVDVTKEWQTATQQSCALEKAYIRGRQYEADRFNELRKKYINGWIP